MLNKRDVLLDGMSRGGQFMSSCDAHVSGRVWWLGRRCCCVGLLGVRLGVFSVFCSAGRLLCEEGREDAWQGAEVNSRLPDQGIESLRDVRSERREGAGVGVGLLRLCGDNRRRVGSSKVYQGESTDGSRKVTGKIAGRYSSPVSHLQHQSDIYEFGGQIYLCCQCLNIRGAREEKAPISSTAHWNEASSCSSDGLHIAVLLQFKSTQFHLPSLAL